MSYFDYPEGSNEGIDKSKSPPPQYVFENISINEWKRLFNYAQIIEFVPDQTLVLRGRLDKNIYILLKGEVILLKPHPLFSETMITNLGKGDIFGEDSFFNNSPREETAKGVIAGRCLRFNYEGYSHLLSENPRLAYKFFANIATVFAKKNAFLYAHKKTS